MLFIAAVAITLSWMLNMEIEQLRLLSLRNISLTPIADGNIRYVDIKNSAAMRLFNPLTAEEETICDIHTILRSSNLLWFLIPASSFFTAGGNCLCSLKVLRKTSNKISPGVFLKLSNSTFCRGF